MERRSTRVSGANLHRDGALRLPLTLDVGFGPTVEDQGMATSRGEEGSLLLEGIRLWRIAWHSKFLNEFFSGVSSGLSRLPFSVSFLLALEQWYGGLEALEGLILCALGGSADGERLCFQFGTLQGFAFVGVWFMERCGSWRWQLVALRPVVAVSAARVFGKCFTLCKRLFSLCSLLRGRGAFSCPHLISVGGPPPLVGPRREAAGSKRGHDPHLLPVGAPSPDALPPADGSPVFAS
eukprot:Gb_30535 [translate_table: standard]